MLTQIISYDKYDRRISIHPSQRDCNLTIELQVISFADSDEYIYKGEQGR